MSVLDHDRIGSDDFAGEVVVHLPSLQPISLDDSIEKQPAVILPLKRPNKPTDGPYVVYISLLIFERLETNTTKYSKTCVKWPLKKDKIKVPMANGS